MKFKKNPFWLHPIKGDRISKLFINRDDELMVIQSVLETEYQKPSDICAIIGGTGIGKSSLLYQTKEIANDLDYDVGFKKGTSDLLSGSEDLIKSKDVAIIDDIDKLKDDQSEKFYNQLESLIDEITFVFFSDSYHRAESIRQSRSFVTTHSLTLPNGLNDDKLIYFLEKRMKNCLIKDAEEFELPFENTALEMATIRSRGNLRKFFNYAQTGWDIHRSQKHDTVTKEDMGKGIGMEDKTILGSFDNMDYKIIWHTTRGRFHKKLLAHECDTNRVTLNKRLKGPLSDLIVEEKKGKEIEVTSLYRKMPQGKQILEGMLRDLRVDIEKL